MHKAAFRERNWLAAALVAALAVMAGVSAVAFIRSWELDSAQNALNGVYRKALYETCEYTEGMAVNLNKLTVAGGSARASLLSDIIRQAQGAQANLALLPLSSSSTAQAMKYINQAGDFAGSMLDRIALGGDITQDEYADITRLSETAAELSIGLGTLLEKHEAGEIVLGADIDSAAGEAISGSAVEYPTLLYDGPFSDGAKGADFRALDGLREVSAEEAESLLREFAGAESVSAITLDGESTLGTACYEFSLTSNGHELSAAVTKQGGQVLYMLSYSEVDTPVLSDAECFRIAQSFLLSRGYGSMEISYFSRYGGVMTINFAATQNGVILYPDLIKLQISMADGAVIGVEAGNYLRNHVERVLEMPALTEDDAAALINPRLSVESVRLCVIPYGAGEKYCYEVSASSADGTYLIYIDAMTGAEVEIMQVVGDQDSTLVM